MTLPRIKHRNSNEFHLVNDFHSKLDAQKELNKLRSENALFGKRKTFIFSSKNANIQFQYGVYEQIFYAN